MSDSYRYRLLLAQAARFYERHEAGRQDPFNVFSVLRSESDEVNLHSRFLHALLDYKRPGEKIRENLTDFLQHVGVKDFEQSNVKVERERDNIDILITNGDRKAVAIENKIRAKDQLGQLQRYHQKLKDADYSKIHLLYLTPDGDAPSKNSVGDLDCKPIPISYKYDLPPWLKRCQERAYDEPALRESVAQYVQLVQKLTGTDFSEAYMKDLTELCLQGNNLVLVHDLNEAMIDAKVLLLKKLWCEIDAALNAEISDIPSVDETFSDYDYPSERKIKHFFTAQRNRYHALYYPFGDGAGLGVAAGEKDGLIFGVECNQKKYPKRHENLRQALSGMDGGTSTQWWPWCREADGDLNLKNLTQRDLRRLSSEADRKEHAKGIAQGLVPVWKKVKADGLARDSRRR